MTQRHRNQLDIYDPEIDWQKSVLIVWAWWIWSTTTYALAQMGIIDITVIDFDELENHNIATQFYREDQLWKWKLESLKENVKQFTWVEIKTIEWLFKAEYVEWMDIVIMWVDNMKTRKEIAEACESSNVSRLIDCRMKAEFFVIYNFIPQYELDLYLQKRYSDDEADEEKCTLKWVSYNCLWIASILARIVKWIIKEEKHILDKFELWVDLHNLQIT